MKKISNHVNWAGKTDWELKTFHGDEYSTWKGSSYNSYLVQGKEKTVLIDTVWLPYEKEFVKNLEKEIDLSRIDAVIMNHNEIDHSGALEELMERLGNVPIYCTEKGEEILRGHYHKDWNFVHVKTGDQLDLGDVKLTFIEAPMLHWPDTMFTYMDGGEGERILFSNDGFGQHFASESLFDDEVDMDEVEREAIKYYANILNLYSPQVKKKLKEILDLHLPLDIIAPSHGVIFRKHPERMIENYQKWSEPYQEDQVTIIYDTMWQSTRKMADAIARGIKEVSPERKVVIMNASKDDKNDIVTEVFKSKGILAGSPTFNYGILYSVAGLMEMIKGLRFKNKKAASFGSYGWSGGSTKQLDEMLKKAGFSVEQKGLELKWVPDEEAEKKAEEFGRQFAESLS